MKFTPKQPDSVLDSLEPVIKGLNLSLVELNISQHKGSVQVRVVVYKEGVIGIDDCSKVHRAIIPRLELAFAGKELFIEVSSPGIERLIKDGSEFVNYIGRTIKCYYTDISDWISGVLISSDERHIEIRGKDGMKTLELEKIAKAKLDSVKEAVL